MTPVLLSTLNLSKFFYTVHIYHQNTLILSFFHTFNLLNISKFIWLYARLKLLLKAGHQGHFTSFYSPGGHLASAAP